LKTNSGYWFILLVSVLFSGCASSKLKVESQSLDNFLQDSEAFKNSFAGFSLYDPEKGKYIYEHNADKFFTPASNTKIFTFYTARKIFKDSIPGILYENRNDTLFFTGTGDPTFLDEDLPRQPVHDFLKNTGSTLVYAERDFYDDRFGPGWAWDDYMYYFSPEKCSMPIYANVVHFSKYPDDLKLNISPERFNRSVMHLRDSVFSTSREENENMYTVRHGPMPDTVDRRIPFIYSTPLFLRLLRDSLGKRIYQNSENVPVLKDVIYSQHIDSVMKKMMIVSDNFIAEQMLIMGAGHLFDTLDADLCIEYAIDQLIPELEDQIDWVDGSGLSRYNKFTPRAINVLLQKIYNEYPKELILDIFPKGGVSGTLKNNFNAKTPYIVAKTGSMSNVYNLSGYLITKKGKWLVFSFMNNNFEVPTTDVKQEMEKILVDIHENY
jgi:D-alanyl-D-alanine carboxypeptidase/D-alanyl-D-alanine-endopeptidase (penicillin-binding protein 4)